MRWAIVLLATAGCLEPNLTPCGDLECAAGATCLADRHVCAFPDALATCDGKPDGTLCQTLAIDGACDRGLCVASVCGDGAATGREQCDGTIADRTCADFRFYYGELACTSSCLIDTSGCSGSCGDGLVQSDHGEICDGTTPPRGCYELGHDYGHVTCTAQCIDSSVTDCGEWVPPQLLVGDSELSEDYVHDVWKALDLVVVSRDSGLVVFDHGHRSEFAGTFQRIAAHGDSVVVGHGAEIDRIDHGMLVAEPALGAIATNTVVAQDFAPTGELWAITADCQVRTLLNGAWVVQPAFPDTQCTQIAVDGAGDVYAASATAVKYFDGTNWVKTLTGDVHSLNNGMGGNLIAITGSDTFELHRTMTTKTLITGYWFDATTVGDAYLGVGILPTRFWNGSLVSFSSMTDDPTRVRRFADGSVALFDQAIYILQPIMTNDADPNPRSGVAAGTKYEFVSFDTHTLYAFYGPYHDLGVVTIADIAISGNTVYALTTTAGVIYGDIDNPTWTTDATIAGTSIWTDDAGDLGVVAADGIHIKPVGASTWTTLPLHGCAQSLDIAGPSLNELYTMHNCSDGSAQIDEWNGAGWTTVETLLATGPASVTLNDIVMLPDQTIVVSGTRIVIGRNVTWNVIKKAASGASGTSANDIWWAGAANAQAGQITMGHWNGTELALVRPPTQAAINHIAVDAHSIFVTAFSESAILVRWALP